MPKLFRDHYQAKGGFAGIYVYPSPTVAAIEACDEQFMDRLAASLDDLPLFSEEQNDLAAVILGSAHALPFDPEGRIVLPAALLEHAGLDGEATFVGRGTTFQIWQPEAYGCTTPRPSSGCASARRTLSLRRDAGGARMTDAAFAHQPVMLRRGAGGAGAARRARSILDATFGAGGYAAAVLDAAHAGCSASIAIPRPAGAPRRWSRATASG